MRMSQWAHDTFGQRVPLIRQGIAEALSVALENALDAQKVAQTDHLHPFGFTLMSRKFEALAEAFEDLGDVRVVKPGGSQHELVVLDGKLLFPFRYAKDRSISVMSARIGDGRPSALVQALFNRFGPEPRMRQLALHDIAPHAVPVAEALGDLPEDTRLVLIAYACNAHAGLLDAWWGEAELLDRTGSLRWHHCEEIPLVQESAAPARREGEAAAFDQGVLPSPALNPRTGAARLAAPVSEPLPFGPEAASGA
ncbi:hypothetical protein [Nonomuraea gerenzanensis]|uniref:Uncharacterized protein n=1 Tax=Nonomuraea gerenzanensis TaxID=93944 RepID=A0A1M4ENX0_9ACTN|nr:hypothetical protein [Nonomuraea gerenzanensis]UBU12014.1 hypothetical protein LCN96_48255 [Nonomuraea gerenzanensis]SBP00529.1 hypothetical protein BN4615_P10045 [Nonomuraea gerenzanensis]